MNTGNDEDWKTHTILQKQYKKSVRKTRRDARRRYCEEIESVSEVSRLRKVLEKDPQAKLETLKKPDGSYTTSKLKMLNLLVQTHFPDCDVIRPESETNENDRQRPTWERWNEAVITVTKDRVHWTISSFSPFKSLGPDGIYPILLQEGRDFIVSRLVNIYKASLA